MLRKVKKLFINELKVLKCGVELKSMPSSTTVT